MSSIKGFTDYKRREFCNDIECSVQIELNKQKEGSSEYEKTRNICKNNASIPHTNFITG